MLEVVVVVVVVVVCVAVGVVVVVVDVVFDDAFSFRSQPPKLFSFDTGFLPSN